MEWVGRMRKTDMVIRGTSHDGMTTNSRLNRDYTANTLIGGKTVDETKKVDCLSQRR